MERWDIYDSSKKRTGRTMARNDWHMKPGDYHLTVLAMIRTPDGRLLITQRQLNKEWAPGKWEIPGGGVRAGEESREAVLREVAEETGLTFQASQAKLIHTYRNDSPKEQNNYFVDIYELTAPVEASDIHVQPEEVAAFRLAGKEAVRKLGKAGEILHFNHFADFL
jgi:8-oxo-dGTP diphosphatase